MPEPIPGTGESHDEFISRCMSNETMIVEHPDEGDRAEACEIQWDGGDDGGRGVKPKADVMAKRSGVERRYMPIEFRAVGDGDNDEGRKELIIEGYSALFGVGGSEDYGFHEEIASGAFADAIGRDDVRMLFNHDPNYVLARSTSGTLELSEDDTGLFARASLPDTQFARDLYKQIERGDINQQSFAFTVEDEEWEYPESELPRRTLKKLRLFDVSVVTYPFYEDTNIDIAKRSMAINKRQKNKELVDAAKRAIAAAVDASEEQEYKTAVMAELGELLDVPKPKLTGTEADGQTDTGGDELDRLKRKQRLLEIETEIHND